MEDGPSKDESGGGVSPEDTERAEEFKTKANESFKGEVYTIIMLYCRSNFALYLFSLFFFPEQKRILRSP